MEPARDPQSTQGNAETPESTPKPEPTVPPDPARDAHLWDKALVLLLEREEMLLRDIVCQFDFLAHTARQQTWEVTEYIEGET